MSSRSDFPNKRRRHAFAGILLCLAVSGAAAETTVTEPAAPPPEPPGFLSLRGVNLATATWFAATGLPPDTSPALIASRGVPTSPTAILKTDTPGGSGTLFTFLDLESAPPETLGAVLTLGDIDGDDQTFFNGELIGSTSGWGVTDTGQPRTYHIPNRLLRAGRNVLAVRIRGFSDRSTFRIRREPITFAFVPSAPQSSEAAPEHPGLALPRLPEKQVRAAIAAADPTLTGTTPLLRKRSSFGRFGQFLHDGLPMVSEVTPTRVETRNGPSFEVALDAAASARIASGDGEPGVDAWHKLSRVEGAINRQPVVYTALQHLFYPGVIYRLQEGTLFRLTVRFPGRQGSILPLSREELQELLAMPEPPANLEVFALCEARDGAVPALIACQGLAANLTRADDGTVDVTFARGEKQNGTETARVFVLYPTGLREIDLSSRPATCSALASLAAPDASTTATLRQWLRLGLHEPEAVDEYFQVRPDAGTVRIYQVARYAPLPRDTSTLAPPLLFPPPQVEFARQKLGYPARDLPTTATGLLAFSGPVYALTEDAAASATLSASSTPRDKKNPPSPLYVLSYDLPLPPREERGLIAVQGESELKDLLNITLTDLGSTSSLTAVDSLYKGRAQGFQAFSYLTTENRRRLLEDSARVVPLVLAGDGLHQTTEPLSGLSYWWTYFIEGPYFDRFDQDWGNGLPLIGLRYYATYSGDWSTIASGWEGVERMFSWFAVTDDWEWMRASNGRHGHGTGAGDCMNATYGAALAYAALARGCDKTEQEHYGLYTAARAALLALNRFAYNDFALAHSLRPEESLVLGFHEGRGFLVGELVGYSWNVTSLISGNGVQPENFDLYLRYAADPLRDYEKVFEKAFPHWADGRYRYPRPTLYQNNSGYISLPHIYLRARLKMDGFSTLVDHLKSARENLAFWWLAPPVIAEVLNSRAGGAYLADWGRCGFLGGEIHDEEKKKHRVELRFHKPESSVAQNGSPIPEPVVLAIPRPPKQVTINDGPVPLTDSRYVDGKLHLKLRRPGVNSVTVVY